MLRGGSLIDEFLGCMGCMDGTSYLMIQMVITYKLYPMKENNVLSQIPLVGCVFMFVCFLLRDDDPLQMFALKGTNRSHRNVILEVI